MDYQVVGIAPHCTLLHRRGLLSMLPPLCVVSVLDGVQPMAVYCMHYWKSSFGWDGPAWRSSSSKPAVVCTPVGFGILLILPLIGRLRL